MKSTLLLFSTAFLFSAFLNAQFPEFTYEEIGETDENMLCQESLVDVDNDKDLDVIVGSNAGTIWWFENINGKEFKKHLLGENALTNKGGIATDVDGDGLIDQVSGSTWYKNPGNTEVWTRFENKAIISYDMQAADVDGNGKVDIIATSELDGTYIYFPGDKPDKKWKSIKIGEGVPGGIAPNGIADIEGDGDLDIIRSNVWYENVDGSATKWLEHKTLRFIHSQGKFAYSSRVFAVDMDSDGDIDIIQSEANNENASVAWHENKDGRGINWYLHPVGTETEQDLHSLVVADFDNDGDLDIFSGGGPMGADLYDRCFIWENADGQGVKWEKHEVLFKKECVDAMAGDIDGDGDIDIVGKPWKGETIYLLRNGLK
ncbi:MAG: VCBS repeat-containing protein [Bacteroidales bacterium]|nr:VCBS repeat-containing protein [Bacteroidales bacterium]MBN2821284.1 VCBS repeat-containing protein [Bacteroidales bacterium]